MDLEIEDVAELLNVSETTIQNWVKEGKIPAYELNRQYRFSRSQIEDWMMKSKLQHDAPFKEGQIYPPIAAEAIDGLKGGMQQFSLYRAMHKGGVLHEIEAKNKKELIQKVMQKTAARLGLDPEVITELLLDREALMSTALDNGIAVPHPRESVLTHAGSDCIITVFPSEPLEYGALDGRPVHTLFFLFSSSDKTHLHLLSKLAHLSSHPLLLEMLASKPSGDSLLAAVKEWESKLKHSI